MKAKELVSTKIAKTPKPADMKGTLRHCGFTLHNYKQDEVDKLENYVRSGMATFLIMQSEVCPTTQTPHLQGYVQFGKGVTWRKLKNDIHERIHITPVNGTVEQNIAYCSKDLSEKEPGGWDGVYRFRAGTPSQQGVKNGSEKFLEDIYAGKSKNELLRNPETAIYAIRYPKGTDNAITAVGRQPKRCYQTVGVAITGVTRAGKTTVANQFPNCTQIARQDQGLWFDSMDSEAKTVIMDEMEEGTLSKPMYKRMIDFTPYSVPIKGGFYEWKPHYFVMCSNDEPDQWFKGTFITEPHEGWQRMHVHIQALSRKDSSPVCEFSKFFLPKRIGFITSMMILHKDTLLTKVSHEILCDQHTDTCDQTCKLDKIIIESTLEQYGQKIQVFFYDNEKSTLPHAPNGRRSERE